MRMQPSPKAERLSVNNSAYKYENSHFRRVDAGDMTHGHQVMGPKSTCACFLCSKLVFIGFLPSCYMWAFYLGITRVFANGKGLSLVADLVS